MKRYGIELQALFISLVPILVMGILLESYFIYTRFADLDRSLQERSRLLARQLASTCEYSVFSGNTVLLKQNIDSALLNEDVEYVSVFDSHSKLLMNTRSHSVPARENVAVPGEAIQSDAHVLRVTEPILATQINLDELISSPASVDRLGTVVIDISKKRLNAQKEEYLLVSLLFSGLAFAIALVLALRTARRITVPVMTMHDAVRQIAAGDLEIRVPVNTSIRELESLETGINEMAQHLLEDRDMLENRIVETTDGLRMKSREIEQAQQEKSQLNENLAVALRELQAIMEANPDLLYVFNRNGELIQWNTSLAKFCGLPPEKMRNMRLSEFVSEEDRDGAARRIMDVFTKGAVTLEVNLLRHDGVKVPYLCNGVALRNARNEVTGFTGTGRDISDRKAMIEQMHRMAHYDMLTDLPNRSLLSERLQQTMIVCNREHRQFALMFLDLDMFKYINDKFGHDVGDMLLKEAAKRIVECLRASDTPARIGGDEFVVLLPSIDSEQMAVLVAEKIRDALSMPFAVDGLRLSISTSIGIALYPEHGSDEKLLLKNADTAMYLAKKKGRNTVVVYSGG
jgi:diguanylate cyclase (GGDEF)-like protein/PAS domain S-box-containing protein